MALIIPPGYAQCVLTFTGAMFDSGGAAVTFGWGQPLGDDPTSFQAFANIIIEAFDDNLKAQMDADVALTEVSVFGAIEGATVSTNIAGTASRISTAPSNALLVSKTTGRRGRRARGRNFWPAMLARDDVNEDGTLTTPALTTNQAAMDAFTEVLGLFSTGTMVILQNEQEVEDGQPVGTPPLSPPPEVISYAVQPKIATQRRRLRR